MVQMVATDLRIRVESLQRFSERLALGRRAGSKFELVLSLSLRERIATYRACRACAWAGERATRSGHWQSADTPRPTAVVRITSWVHGQRAGNHRGSRPGSYRPVTKLTMPEASGCAATKRARTSCSGSVRHCRVARRSANISSTDASAAIGLSLSRPGRDRSAPPLISLFSCLRPTGLGG